MLLAIAGLVLALSTGAAADVTGTWEGTLIGQRPDGTTSEDGAYLVLKQKGSEVTGTVGGNVNDQHPITKGSIDGSKVLIEATHSTNGREYKVELTVEGDQMKGTVTSGDRTAQVNVKRLKS
jgi:hypothetical protein